jgi:haloalkane dehalogenase
MGGPDTKLHAPQREPRPSSIYPPDFPFEPRFIEVNGRRLAYFDEGRGPQTLLFMHGNPAAAYVYERLLRLLVPDFRCIAPDLLGFGLSEKPASEASYSLTGHITLIRDFIKKLDLHNLVVIGHDWGGPIAFGAALQEPQRCTHLVILNTITEAPMKIMPVYWLPFYGLLRAPRLYNYLVKQRGLFQKLGLAIMEPQDRQVYLRANHNPATRAGIAAFPNMIPHSTTHPNYPILRDILAGLKTWDIPALVIFSDHDSVFSSTQGERFAKALLHAKFALLSGPKHFLQYERPAEISRLIRGFLAT